jgi:16S rRNA (cytidine1402-2'-O)-methyltransferase
VRSDRFRNRAPGELPFPERVSARIPQTLPDATAVNLKRKGQLYIVSTPIGNLADITIRALDVLKTVDIIAAEDTRHSRALLEHYGISTPMTSYHEHNEARETERLLARLENGESVALISDAGTPLLSDPGSRLVQACIQAGIIVVPVPGASALLAALVSSGIAADQFVFLGFLPRKGKERAAMLDTIVRSQMTVVLYEAPNRVRQTLADLAERGAGERKAVVARELTKMFETLIRGTVGELAEQISDSVKGEVVITIAGAEPVEITEEALRARAQELRASGATPRQILEQLMGELGAPRNLAYRIAHEE